MKKTVKTGPVPFKEYFGKYGEDILKIMDDYGIPKGPHLKALKKMGIEIPKSKKKPK
jgi:hypothetical protein